MKYNEKVTEALNDLIQINNDRVEGYEKAAAQTKDNDLLALSREFISQSRQYAQELSRLVAREGEEPASGTTLKGKIYRAWMDVKATFTGKDRKSTLASCEFGEDAAQNAYADAMEEDLPEEVRELLITQKQDLRAAHDRIKALRDAQPV